jgi:hypothetical protein
MKLANSEPQVLVSIAEELNMLETYFDESAPSDRTDESILIIAGYVGEDRQWVEFSQRWQGVLDRFRLSGFHMRHIRNLRHPLYRRLSGDDRRKLVLNLIEIVSQTALLGSLVYLRPAEYEALTTPEFRTRYGSAYGMLVFLNLLQISRHLTDGKEAPPTTRVIVEGGHANAGDALRVVANWKFDTDPAPKEIEGEAVQGEPQPARVSALYIEDARLGTKEANLPLHAADMLAYLANSSLAFKIDDFLRGLFDDLLPRIPHLSTGYPKREIESLVAGSKAREEENAAIRAGWQDIRQALHSVGVKMKIYPWGVSFDGRHLSDEEWEAARERMKAEVDKRR